MFGFFFVSLQFLQLVLGYSTLTAAVALLPMALVMLPLSAFAGHARRSATATSSSAAPGSRSRPSGFGLVRHARPRQRLPAVPRRHAHHRRRRRARDDAGHQRDRRSLPREKQGVASAVNDTARELGAAFGVAVLGSAFNIGYRNAIDGHLGSLPADVADQAREAPAIALQVARGPRDGSALEHAVREAFSVGMRYALLVGAGCWSSARCSCGSAARPATKRCSRTSSTATRPDPRILTRTRGVRRRACRVSLNSAG